MISWFIPASCVLYWLCFILGSEANCNCSFADCEDYWMAGHRETGEYHVVPMGMVAGHNIFCDMDGGGWIIIQKHINGREDFNKTWKEYEEGFGDLGSGYWIGLWRLWTIIQQGHYKLRIAIRYSNGTEKITFYKYFRIGGPDEKYKLKAYLYTGKSGKTAGDSLTSQNGQQFSTRDEDNDNSTINCAEELGGGWWFSDCGQANLNGNHVAENIHPGTGGIRWETLEPGNLSKLSATKMMIKRN